MYKRAWALNVVKAANSRLRWNYAVCYAAARGHSITYSVPRYLSSV